MVTVRSNNDSGQAGSIDLVTIMSGMYQSHDLSSSITCKTMALSFYDLRLFGASHS